MVTLALLALAVASPATPTLDAPVETLTLEEALRELDARNPTLAQARSRAEEALGVVKQSAAPLLPTLAATGGFTRNSEELKLGLPGNPPVTMQPLRAFTGGGSLRVPLVVPEAWFGLGAARDAALAAAASADATWLALRAAFLQTAWSAAAGEEIIAASRRAVDAAREQVRSSRRQFQAGTGTNLATLQAQTEATRRESDLVRARSEAARAELALAVLLGRTGPVRIPLGEPRPSEAMDLAALSSEALERRPEIRAQASLVRSTENQARSAWWRLAPQLSATGQAFASDVAYPTGKKEGWRVTVDLTWTLYDGGFRYGKARQAEAAEDGARAAETSQRLAVLQEVQNGVRDVEVAREHLRLGDEERATAAEAAASAKRTFEAGVASSLDVLTANERLYQTEVAVADARARLGGALAALDRAVGRLP
jgi:outer membrane protein TolC